MDIYASDEEKGEAIKQWWRDHALTATIIFVLGVAAIAGGRYWVTYQHTQTEQAAEEYQHLLSLLASDKFAEAEDITQRLLSELAHTPYAVFSAFEMAKQSMQRGDVSSAKIYLDWVMIHAKLAGQVDIARLRLARLLIAEQDYQEALALIEQPHHAVFSSLFTELRGDIYIAQGKVKQAQTAYQNASFSLQESAPRKQLLKFKLDDL